MKQIAKAPHSLEGPKVRERRIREWDNFPLFERQNHPFSFLEKSFRGDN